MTDGMQTRDVEGAEDLHIASKPLKEKGVQVYSLGIGANYDIGELLDTASDERSVFKAGNFEELLSIVSSITQQTCKGNLRSNILFCCILFYNIPPNFLAFLKICHQAQCARSLGQVLAQHVALNMSNALE